MTTNHNLSFESIPGAATPGDATRNRNPFPTDRHLRGAECPFRSWSPARQRTWLAARRFRRGRRAEEVLYDWTPNGVAQDYWRGQFDVRAADPADHRKIQIMGGDMARGPDIHIETLVYSPEGPIATSLREHLEEAALHIRENMLRQRHPRPGFVAVDPWEFVPDVVPMPDGNGEPSRIARIAFIAGVAVVTWAACILAGQALWRTW